MISVERFKNERFRRNLERMAVTLLVVDEAHCISEWGHNFRPEYLKIPQYRSAFNMSQVLLLTATAAPRVLQDMCEKFAIPRDNAVVTGFHRPNLQLEVRPTAEADKEQTLLELIRRDPVLPTIVYATRQKTAERIAELLQPFAARAYHAGMKSEERERVQDRFMAGEIPIVAATIAFGMGIDKADIRRVIHYDLPKSIENYSQEIGRAGPRRAARSWPTGTASACWKTSSTATRRRKRRSAGWYGWSRRIPVTPGRHGSTGCLSS
jgi:ATP-dependent DNA helicase RecQ